MCLLQCPIILFFGKAKFSFYKFQLEGGNAVIFHTRHENDLKTKQTESEGIFRRQNLQYSRKICLRHTVFVLNKVRVFVSGAYRHTQHAQTWLFTQKIISEEKIIISTLDKYCAFIIVNFILYFNKCTNRLRADSLSLNCILVQSNLWITTTEGTGNKWSYFSGGLICQAWFKNFQYRVVHMPPHEPSPSAIGSSHMHVGA